MYSKNYKNKYKFLFISFCSFLISIITLNFFFFITKSESFSAKVTVSIIFVLNLSFLLKYYKLKISKIFFPLLFFLFSIFFRFFEYYLFLFLIQKGILLNISWIVSLSISFICKFLIFDKFFSKDNY